ncbi:hypothetical protein [Streptomyces sp. NPDC056144]|uniref:hypothetical protein n=1 Tax=unclassified Streptomyces TaxID=2593676 RepID=UPI0035D77EC2
MRRDPKHSAERAADALRTRLALHASEEPRPLGQRTLSAVVAGEVTRREETFFALRPNRPGPPVEGARWSALPEVSALPGPPLPPDLAELLSAILTESGRPAERAAT